MAITFVSNHPRSMEPRKVALHPKTRSVPSMRSGARKGFLSHPARVGVLPAEMGITRRYEVRTSEVFWFRWFRAVPELVGTPGTGSLVPHTSVGTGTSHGSGTGNRSRDAEEGSRGASRGMQAGTGPHGQPASTTGGRGFENLRARWNAA